MSDELRLSRRRLIGASAAALAAPAFLSAQNRNDELQVGIIGVGGRGTTLLRRLVKSPNVRVAAICDIDEEARQQAAQIASADNPDLIIDYRTLLDRDDLDAVVIATPVDLHKEMAVAALEVHKNLYLEKPIGRTPEEVKAVMQAVDASRGMLQLGFQLRHDPARRAAIEEIHKGGIGQVAYMQGDRHGGDLPPTKPWLFNAHRSGNIIVEQAVHIIDLMNWAVKTHPIRAMGSGGTNVYRNDPPGRTIWDNYAVIYEYPGDVRFTFTHIYLDPPGFAGIEERIWGSEAAVDLPSATKVPLVDHGRERAEPIKLWEGESEDATQSSVDAFFENIRSDKEPLNNAEYGKYATLAAIMGRIAIEEERFVEWHEVDI